MFLFLASYFIIMYILYGEVLFAISNKKKELINVHLKHLLHTFDFESHTARPFSV